MAEKAEVELDRSQVKKAVQALKAFLKTKSSGNSLLLDDTQHISLLFTLWRIPKQAQTIRIPLPHGQQTSSDEICLFTRDEPKMTSDQTQRFYKRLLQERGVTNISEIIPYKVLKTEYKPYEAKRRLLGNFDMFISDDRIRRLLPSHLGKHFYERKKEPLCVNLLSKNLARDIQSIIQGSRLKVTNKGSCCMARIGHSGLTADQLTENIEAAVKTIMTKIRMKGRVMKVIHLKSERSVALPIYHSDLSHLKQDKKTDKENEADEEKTGEAKEQEKNEEIKETKTDAAVKEEEEAEVEEEEEEVEEEEEEIPQLVPVVTPKRKAKVEKTPTKRKKTQQLEKAPKPAAAKKEKKSPSKVTKKTKTAAVAKSESKVKRKVPKVK